MSEPSLPANACPKCGAALPVAATEGLCPRCLMVEAMVPTHPAAEPAAPQPTLAPAALAPHFPQLEILQCLGRGGMGVVYLARQKALNRLVALKVLAPERVLDPRFAGRFAREAQALATLNHPNIVTIHDFGQTGGLYFLLMEYVDGVNLRQAMKAGRFTPEQALAIVPPVCEALQYAHDHGIVHRDIKPENLLLDKDGRVKIADFGIARMLGGNGARLGSETQPRHSGASGPAAAGPTDTAAIQLTVAGTPQYTAPEQRAEPQKTDHRADIYSLGIVLYELLTGELPGAKLQPPSRKVQIDVRLDEIVLRALEAKPELRYQTAAEFRTQVETFSLATQGSGESASDPKPPITRPWPRRVFWLIVTVLAVPFGLLAVFLLAPQLAKHGITPQETFAVSAVIGVIGLLLLAVLFGLLRSFCGTSQDADNPWSRRLLWIVVALLLIPVVWFPLSLLLPNTTLFGVATRTLLIYRSLAVLLCLLLIGLFVAMVLAFRRTRLLDGKLWLRTGAQIGVLIVGVPLLVLTVLLIGYLMTALSTLTDIRRGFQEPPMSASLPSKKSKAYGTSDRTPTPTSIQVRRAKSAAFIAELPNGLKIELVALSRHPSTGQPWWKPDGTPAAETFDPNPVVGVAAPRPDTKNFQLIYRLSSLSDVSGSAYAECQDQVGFIWPWNASQGGQQLARTFTGAATLATDENTTEVRISVATGPWAIDQALPDIRSTGALVHQFDFAGLPWKFDLKASLTNNQIRISGRIPFHSMKWYPELIVLDLNGAELRSSPARMAQTVPPPENGTAWFDRTYDGVTLANIHELRFRTRPYQWVQFRNVSLEPGRKTDVIVTTAVVEGGTPRPSGPVASAATSEPSAKQSAVSLEPHLSELYGELAAALVDLKDAHPKVRALRSEIAAAEAELAVRSSAGRKGPKSTLMTKDGIRIEGTEMDEDNRTPSGAVLMGRQQIEAPAGTTVQIHARVSDKKENTYPSESARFQMRRGFHGYLRLSWYVVGESSTNNTGRWWVNVEDESSDEMLLRFGREFGIPVRWSAPNAKLDSEAGLASRVRALRATPIAKADPKLPEWWDITLSTRLWLPGDGGAPEVPVFLPVIPPPPALPYSEFDQTPGRGWRALADQKQFTEAARLIESYLAVRADIHYPDRANLHFHAAQCLAFADEKLRAIMHLEQSRYQPASLDDPVKWNDYVDATEAFLKGELQALKASRERIAQGPKANGEIPNLGVVDRLIARFGQPYATAYGE